MPILIRFFLLALQVSVFVMAQEEGFSPLGESAMPSFQPTQFCGLNELPDTNTQSIDTASQSCEEVSSPARLPTTLGPAEVNDDEVQFVFSVPRRRKKKRKRQDSSYNSSSISQVTKTPTSPSSTSTIASQTRRGSTGMVQQLESCHIGGRIHNAAKGGSLPAITPTLQAGPTSPAPASAPLSNETPPYQPSPPSGSESPWWDKPTSQIQDDDTFEFDVCGMPFAEEILRKRKYEGEVEEPRASPARRSPGIRGSAQTECLQGLSNSINTTGGAFTQLCGSSNSQDPFIGNQAQASSADFTGITPVNLHKRLSPVLSNKVKPINGLWHQLPQQNLSRCLPLSWPSRNWGGGQQTIQVPASFVPEQSVSPRTRTVQVPRPLCIGQVQPRHVPPQWPAIQGAPAVPTPHSVSASPPQSTPESSEPLTGSDNQTNNASVPSPHAETLRPPQTDINDLLRKPSLYKIPPWPSPLVPSHSKASPTTQRRVSQIRLGLDESTEEKQQLSMEMRSNLSVPSIGQTERPPSKNPLVTSPVPVPRGSPSLSPYRKSSQCSSLPAGPINQSPATLSTGKNSPGQYTSPYPRPNQAQGVQPTRRHSPNLVVDIAETCQENFPFAAIAERHQVPIQKVFDTFSAIIQLPLLRCAADNRRHGSLGKTRLKEFRDAKKAMEKAQEQERKKAQREAKTGEGGDPAIQKRGKKAPALLKAAILNSARGKDGDSSP